MQNWINEIALGNFKYLARAISYIENSTPGYEQILQNLIILNKKVIGITGPPGAGKSTLTDALIENFIDQGKSIAVLAIDPSSPFSSGALLGDRIRMNRWYNHPKVYIRSIASRGLLGGLSAKIIEITDCCKAAPFDYILIETVGTGQNEVEIGALADCTIVTLVPDAGDEIQILKSGLLEIADIFVINKCDREGSDILLNNLHMASNGKIQIFKTIASLKTGVKDLFYAIQAFLQNSTHSDKYFLLLANKAYHLIAENKMKDLNKEILLQEIKSLSKANEFNIYKFIKKYTNGNNTQ